MPTKEGKEWGQEPRLKHKTSIRDAKDKKIEKLCTMECTNFYTHIFYKKLFKSLKIHYFYVYKMSIKKNKL